jgi:hypothetical protein
MFLTQRSAGDLATCLNGRATSARWEQKAVGLDLQSVMSLPLKGLLLRGGDVYWFTLCKPVTVPVSPPSMNSCFQLSLVDIRLVWHELGQWFGYVRSSHRLLESWGSHCTQPATEPSCLQSPWELHCVYTNGPMATSSSSRAGCTVTSSAVQWPHPCKM